LAPEPESIDTLLRRKIGIGAYAVLNTAAKRAEGKTFAQLLVEDSFKAVELATRALGPQMAKYLEKQIIPVIQEEFANYSPIRTSLSAGAGSKQG
jgi:predicted Fe-Mo cluster-binding NifX family protein